MKPEKAEYDKVPHVPKNEIDGCVKRGKPRRTKVVVKDRPGL